MKPRRGLLLLAILVLVVIGLGLLLGGVSADPSGTVSGAVVDAEGPVAGATVREQGTDNVTSTAADGRFTLGTLTEGQEIEVTAWADGYYIASTHVTPTVSGITLTLRPYHTTDHPGYAWPSPISGTSEGACGNCHPVIVSQWITNAHGGAISNPRFFSMYNGTDVSGTVQVAPGYLDDFPDTAGNCANCHASGAGVDGYLTTNMNDVRDVVTAGVHCDYCHKVGGAYLNPATGSVYPNVPGAQSQRVLRPPEGDDIFFGPYDDIHDPDTYLPVMTQSQFCAPCHQFSFWGTPIYESYQEWLSSPYAGAGVTCQDCHMPPTGDTYFALPEVGGREHPPERIPSHLQLGATNVELLQNTVSMTLSARQVADNLRASVTITNTDAGHHVPTDFPARNMILLVRATDDRGRDLVQVDGPTVPDWGGVGPDPDDYAGWPGKGYAKVLRDVVSGESPVASYWKQALIQSDNRLAAFEADTTTCDFLVPDGGGNVEVEARLIFRRAFKSLAEAKGWEVEDIVMETEVVAVSLRSTRKVYLPAVWKTE